MPQSARAKRQKWSITVVRKNKKDDLHEVPLATLAQTPEEMSANIIELERLRRIFYADYEKPMKKKILKFVRR